MRLVKKHSLKAGKWPAAAALALVMLLTCVQAAPSQPSVTLTHSGDGDRLVMECTAKVAPPEEDSVYRVGMTLTMHHHMGTGVQTAEEIDRFMDIVDPEKVFLLFDSGHLTFAGIDPLPILKKYIGRIRHIHLKDVRLTIRERAEREGWSFLTAVRGGVFTVPGDGDVDFAPLFDVIEESGYEGWVVVEAEQDPALANPFEYAKMARAYIREKTGL